jgi:predicted DNA-binding transcriptional regulator YafY
MRNGMHSIRERLRRCLQLLNLLQSRIGYGINDLAHEFEVSKRTVYRDIRFLEETGIPVHYDPQKGGYVLRRHFNFSVSAITTDELKSLFLAAHIFSLSCTQEVWYSIHQAISKLLAQMPTDSREKISNLLSSIRGNPSLKLWPEGPPGVAAEILSAISLQRQVRIIYDSPEGIVGPIRTKVTPNCLMASDGRWYLVGRSSWHRKTQHFDLEYIQLAEQASDLRVSTAATLKGFERLNGPEVVKEETSIQLIARRA